MEAGWELASVGQLHEWWADDTWQLRSVWAPQGLLFNLTFLVDPQLDLHRRRQPGEGIWAASASLDTPKTRAEAEAALLFNLGRGWEKRLPRFVQDVARFRGLVAS